MSEGAAGNQDHIAAPARLEILPRQFLRRADLRVLQQHLAGGCRRQQRKAAVLLLNDGWQRQTIKAPWRGLDDPRLELQPLCRPDDIDPVGDPLA